MSPVSRKRGWLPRDVDREMALLIEHVPLLRKVTLWACQVAVSHWNERWEEYEDDVHRAE